MGSEGYYVRRFSEIYRVGLLDGKATRLLRKAAATAIAKLEAVTVAINESNNRRQMLLSLKLRGSAIESRCRKTDGISGGVSGL